MNRHFIIARREFRSVVFRPRFLLMAFLNLFFITFAIGSSIFILEFTVSAKGGAFLFNDGRSALAREFSEEVAHDYKSFSEAQKPASLPLDVSAEQFREFAKQQLGRQVETRDGRKPLDFIVWATPDRTQINVWATEEAKPLVQPLRHVLARLSRDDQLPPSGGSPSRTTSEEAHAPNLEFSLPSSGTGREFLILTRVSGIAYGYLIFIIVVLTSSALLQSMAEEKSSRLMESLLALCTPQEIFGGKLLGMAAVALLTGGVWTAVVFFGFQLLPSGLVPPATHLMIIRSLAWLSSIQGASLAVFYFLSAYLMMAIPLLTVGAMSHSVQDSAPLQFPIILLFAPILVFLSVNAASPDTHYLTLLSWVPIYTPFAMPTRLGENVSILEVLGTAITMLIFMVVEYKLAGLIICNTLLKSGPRPRIRRTMALR